MNKYRVLIFTMLLFLVVGVMPARAEKTEVFMFTAPDCSYCKQAVKYFELVKKSQYPNIAVINYDLSVKGNATKYFYYTNAYEIDSDQAPIVFIGEEVIEGYQPSKYKANLDYCESNDCISPEQYVIENTDEKPGASFDSFSLLKYPKLMIWGLVIFAVIVVIASFFVRRKPRK
jgi:glutaredoxin